MTKILICPEFGVNPSVQNCRFCEKGIDVVLFGPLNIAKYEKLFGGQPSSWDIKDGRVKAPASFSGVFPCEGCEAFKTLTAEGCALFKEGSSHYVVVKNEAISRIFDPEMAKATLDKRAAVVSVDAWKTLGLP